MFDIPVRGQPLTCIKGRIGCLTEEQSEYVLDEHNEAVKRSRQQAPAHTNRVVYRAYRAANLPDPVLRACYADPIPGITQKDKYTHILHQLQQLEREREYQIKENAASRARAEKAEADKERCHSVNERHARIGGLGRSPPAPTLADLPRLRYHQDAVADQTPRTSLSTRTWA